MKRRTACVLAITALVEACGKKKTTVSPPVAAARRAPLPAVPAGTVERGLASWYGRPYHGRPAADGEIYDMEAMVAAHKTLPFQTRVRVRLISTGKTVDVRIIDRGPFVRGRVIDLSHAAAQAVGLTGPGVGEVEITVLDAPVAAEPARVAVQVGAFRDKANADRMQQSMATAYGAAKLVLRGGDPPLWRVLVGRAPSVEDAETLAGRVRAERKVPEAFVVRLDL